MRRTGNRQGARLTPRGRQAAPAPEPRGEAAGPSGGRKGGLRSGICRQAVRPTGTARRRDAVGAADRDRAGLGGTPGGSRTDVRGDGGSGPTGEQNRRRGRPCRRFRGQLPHRRHTGAAPTWGGPNGTGPCGPVAGADGGGTSGRTAWLESPAVSRPPIEGTAAGSLAGPRLATSALRGAPVAVRGASRRPEAFAQATATT